MDRDGAEMAGPSSDSRIAKTSRFTSPLVINSASQRRSLFSRPRAKEDSARPTSSGALSDNRVALSNNTKIPRPAQRLPFSLADAYRMAEEEEAAAHASPSPAPRLWRSRRDSGEKSSKTPNPGSAGLQHRLRIHAKSPQSGPDDDLDNIGAQSRLSSTSDSTFDEKLRQYALDQPSSEEPPRRSNGLFSRSKLGTKLVGTGKELVRKTSRGSLDGNSSPQPNRAATNGRWLSRRLSARKREPSNASSTDLAHADNKPDDEPLQPDTVPQDPRPPDKSFAWQADADFTADDLQVSNSPPLFVRRSNTKIEEIRALEAEVNERFSERSQPRQRNTRIDEIRALEVEVNDRFPESSQPPQQSTRIDEIRALEAETALRFPDEPLANKDGNDTRGAKPEGESAARHSRSISRTNTRLDELKSRDIGSLSRRSVAAVRLDELREKNDGHASRSPSPDIARISSKEPLQALSPLGDRLLRLESEALMATAQAQGVPADEPRDVLRRLAVATSTSPSPELQRSVESEALATRDQDKAEGARQKKVNGDAKRDAKPTVGFAGLPRDVSVESGLTKRTSFVHSDSDPTERIEGEMKLFAPLENQSERGSLRAPSPEPEGEAIAETPKSTKSDPLTQPTPRVTGAYVETPATVKVEKHENSATVPVTDNRGTESHASSLRRPSTYGSLDPKSALLRGGRDGTAARQPKRTQSSRGDRLLGRSASLSRRRSRSLSRGRAPLTNSANPPTVKDDLLEIQRVNQIEDSTLDDIADLLSLQDHEDLRLGSRKEDPEDDREKELQAYDRMSRSLKTGLLGIRTAKQGIERLEDKVLHADTKNTPHPPPDGSIGGAPASCPVCHDRQPPAYTSMAYVHLPLPRLWYRKPHFRFTLLGLALFLFSLWYIAESWMCFLYCKPQYCYPGTPCDWSPDDPTWGYAIPVKLDQWVTGGHGRRAARRLEPQAADWLADLWDAATGVDITAVDTSRYSWEQKRQHRRRLAKLARERAHAQPQEMGLNLEEDESIASDEKV
ncbi:hypothetical protein VTK56DRAFT_8687 [Thermocarpiscus australiensis]